jgi:hypothetical protein
MTAPPQTPPQDQSRPTASAVPRAQRRGIWLLLVLPYLALCFPRLYARATPTLLGFPFFYWYQFAWVILTSCLLWIVYLQFRQPE